MLLVHNNLDKGLTFAHMDSEWPMCSNEKDYNDDYDKQKQAQTCTHNKSTPATIEANPPLSLSSMANGVMMTMSHMIVTRSVKLIDPKKPSAVVLQNI